MRDAWAQVSITPEPVQVGEGLVSYGLGFGVCSLGFRV